MPNGVEALGHPAIDKADTESEFEHGRDCIICVFNEGK
jgi:hypothetical protein